ncbi:MAG: GNAT family N-acetyltransferase [bacterium]|nr:GNAT family N-acetyltransferase [bacterium]
MEIKQIKKEYVDEALKLALWEYDKECNACPELVRADFTGNLRECLQALFSKGYGKIAMDEGKLIGYLAFWKPCDGFFGNVKGAFSPLGGSGFIGKNRSKTASKLFAATAEELIKEEICSYAVSRYAHDEEVGKSFVLNGFGIRCSDAILNLHNRKKCNTNNTKITYRELEKEEKEAVAELRMGLIRHIFAAPTFLPSDTSNFYNWFKRDDIRIVAAFDGEKAVGFMSITDTAETFITEYKNMPNICGAFVEQEYRETGIADELLEYVCSICEQEGNTYLGVDCETLNPTALHFWGKHFENYTYSYHRRIDERCIKKALDESVMLMPSAEKDVIKRI